MFKKDIDIVSVIISEYTVTLYEYAVILFKREVLYP